MPKEITTYNGLCPCCGKDAYLGFSSVECSNRECINYDSKEEEEVQEMPVVKNPRPLDEALKELKEKYEEARLKESFNIVEADLLSSGTKAYLCYQNGLFVGYLQK